MTDDRTPRHTSCDSRDGVASTACSSSCNLQPNDVATAATLTPPISGSSDSCDTCTRRRVGRRTLGLRTGALKWRRYCPVGHRFGPAKVGGSGSGGGKRSGSGGGKRSGSGSGNTPGVGTFSHSNSQVIATTQSSSSDDRASSPRSKDADNHSNASADISQEGSSEEELTDGSAVTVEDAPGASKSQATTSDDSPFTTDIHVIRDSGGGYQARSIKNESENEVAGSKADLASLIEKAILDFCSSRTVETMRRMFAGATSEMEALQGDGARQGDKSVQAPHPVTSELVKEGIVIGNIDVFSPRVHREYLLGMKDSLVEGFLRDTGLFRSICYRTKCQLEVTRRLLNRKLCSGGRWVKYLIVRIVGPSLCAISSCDQLLQNAVPAFKQRIEYRKAAYCRLFFREDIPDNSLLYNGYQRTGGTSNRYGALRLETPYRLTTERTVGNCPWKVGALKVGKLSFSGSGGHMSMQQVYPDYGYITATPVESACKGAEAVHRSEQMHGQFLTRRQQQIQDRRVMTIPVCR